MKTIIFYIMIITSLLMSVIGCQGDPTGTWRATKIDSKSLPSEEEGEFDTVIISNWYWVFNNGKVTLYFKNDLVYDDETLETELVYKKSQIFDYDDLNDTIDFEDNLYTFDIEEDELIVTGNDETVKLTAVKNEIDVKRATLLEENDSDDDDQKLKNNRLSAKNLQKINSGIFSLSNRFISKKRVIEKF